MSQLAVDENGRLIRENGSFLRVSGVDEIRQHVRVRLRLIRGEVPWDLTRGMRYFGFMLEKGVPLSIVEGEFVHAISGTPGVVSVLLVASSLETDRIARLEYKATASLGDANRRIPLHDSFTVTAPGGGG